MSQKLEDILKYIVMKQMSCFILIKITIPDHLVIEIVSPDEDDEFAFFFIYSDSGKVLSLGGKHIIDEYHNKDVGYYVACYQA